MPKRPDPELRANILSAATSAFHARGFRGASMRGIAREAGATLSNVYTYFPTKDALLEAALEPTLTPLRQAVSSLGGLDLVDDGLLEGAKLEAMSAAIVDFLDAHQDDLRLLSTGSGGSELEGFVDRLGEELAEAELAAVTALPKRLPGRLRRAPSARMIKASYRALFGAMIDLLRAEPSREELRRDVEDLLGWAWQGVDWFVAPE
ncbi:MAG: TetR/AcrR family transcriptional regulator [Alphaproteobacteria bacterium]|nr:TetR/AcrR family transcriptional regulator [Alphaproteobacteria bacterium]